MRTIAVVCGLFFLLAATCPAGPEIRTLILSGDAAPGLPIGTTFSFFSDPRLNNAGCFSVWADVAGDGVTNATNGSVWSDRTGSLAMTEREGDPAPFGEDWVWAALPSPALGEDGRLGFIASLVRVSKPKDPVQLGLFCEDTEFSNYNVAREGFAAPGGGNALFETLNFAPLGSGGDQAFNAFCTEPLTQGLWSSRTGRLDMVVLRHTPAPGNDGLLFGHFDRPTQNALGVLAFRASLISNIFNREPVAHGLYMDEGAGPQPLATTGQVAPGVPPGAVFSGFGPELVLDDAGRVVFWAGLEGDGVDDSNDSGLWQLGDAGLALIAREGDQAAGVPPGVVYGELSRQPAQAANGAIAFAGLLAGDVTTLNNSGVWVGPSSGPVLIAREGEQAVGMPPGGMYASFTQPVINNTGAIAFLARVRPADGQGPETVALYLANAGAEPEPVVCTGDSIEVRPGDLRTVDEVNFDGGAPGSGSVQLSDSGELIFILTFTDGRVPPTLTYGVFTASSTCRADVDGSGTLDVDDFIAFQIAFAVGDLKSADFTGDGVLDVDDFIAFQTAFGVGCG